MDAGSHCLAVHGPDVDMLAVIVRRHSLRLRRRTLCRAPARVTARCAIVAMARSRGSILPLLLSTLAIVVGLSFVGNPAFAGLSETPVAQRSLAALRGGAVVSAALPVDAAQVVSLTDATTILLADKDEAIPVVAFFVSIFAGVLGYAGWTAFGPGSSELRDPFEEHED